LAFLHQAAIAGESGQEADQWRNVKKIVRAVKRRITDRESVSVN